MITNPHINIETTTLKKYLVILFFFIAFTAVNPGHALAAGCTGTGNCYWVGGTGTSTDPAHWATTDGGATTGGLPGTGDTCNFTANSSTANAAYTFAIAGATNCGGFNMAGPGAGNNISWVGTSTLSIYGSMDLTAGTADMTLTYSGTITFATTTGSSTIDQHGINFASTVNFGGASGVPTWTLQSTWLNTAGSSGGIVITRGMLVANGFNISARGFDLSGTNTKGLDITNVTLTSTNGYAVNSTGTTYTLAGSTVSLTGGGSPSGNWGGYSYNNLISDSIGNLTIPDSNTFANITITWTPTYTTGGLSLGANQIVTGALSISGSTAVIRYFVKSSTAGTARTITAASVSLTNVDFRDINFINSTSPGTPFTGTRLGNATGNSGDIIFDTPSNKYWNGDSGNWNGSSEWATSSNGTTGVNNFPLPQDTVIFDDNSFSANSQTVTINGNYRLPSIDFSTMTNRSSITLATGTQVPTSYGDLKLTTATSFTVTGTGAITLSGRNTQTITSYGISWTQPFTIDSIAGTVKPADPWTLSGATTVGQLTLTAGTFDLNGTTTSVSRFSSSNSNTRTIQGTSGGLLKVTDTTATTVFTTATLTGLTLTRSTWSIEIAGDTTNVRIANLGAGLTWPAIVFSNTTANGGLDIVSSGVATVIKSLSYTGGTAQTIRRTAATTITIEDNNGFFSGTSGNLISIDSITTANHTWAKSGGGSISSDYLSISNSTGTPSSTWYAGANSTNGASNSGWIFTTPPVPTVKNQLKGGSFRFIGGQFRFR